MEVYLEPSRISAMDFFLRKKKSQKRSIVDIELSYLKKHRWAVASSLGNVIKEIITSLMKHILKFRLEVAQIFMKSFLYDKVYLNETISCFSKV